MDAVHLPLANADSDMNWSLLLIWGYAYQTSIYCWVMLEACIMTFQLEPKGSSINITIHLEQGKWLLLHPWRQKTISEEIHRDHWHAVRESAVDNWKASQWNVWEYFWLSLSNLPRVERRVKTSQRRVRLRWQTCSLFIFFSVSKVLCVSHTAAVMVRATALAPRTSRAPQCFPPHLLLWLPKSRDKCWALSS